MISEIPKTSYRDGEKEIAVQRERKHEREIIQHEVTYKNKLS
jgi:hypothetical protein